MDEQVAREHGRWLSRRSFGRAVVLGAPSVIGGAVLANAVLPSPAEAGTAANWSTTGNSGGSPTTNFLGTKDNRSFVVRTNNTERIRVAAAGNVGIAVTGPTARLHVRGTSTPAGLFEHLSVTGAVPVLKAKTASRDPGASAVLGWITDPKAGAESVGVHGAHSGTGALGIGVWGSHAGGGVGVQATAGTGGTAVSASSNNPTGAAVLAENPTGKSTHGAAVLGLSASGIRARAHPGGTYYDAAGEFCGPNGVIGAASTDAASGYGVIGLANNTAGVGVYASGAGGASALLALGNADIFGKLTKSGGSFRIDHPLDPANRYLSHSFVESPDMKNVYDGVVVVDGTGVAAVTLPEWFAALNTDYRYQLTAIGGSAPDLHIAREFDGTSFMIAGGQPGMKVSWQLTGIRQDAWANANRIPIESDKPAGLRGRFLHPELHGADASAQISAIQPAIALA
jgi:hypothetical protein